MSVDSKVLFDKIIQFRFVAFLVALLFTSFSSAHILAQQPTPSPSPTVQTGRSYSITEPTKRPAQSIPELPSPVTFTDVTNALNINYKHAASPTSIKYLLESMGSGVALFDYDNDGRLDIYFTNGARIDDPMPKGKAPEKSDPKFWNRLYRQKPDGTFEDVTEKAGVKGSGYCFGVAAGDYDNDGLTDLYVTAYGFNILYRNNGNGTFTDVTQKTNASTNGWSTSAGWLDYNKDGRLDLFIARYMDWDFEKGSIYCGDLRPGLRAYCHPDNFKGASNALLKQKSDGTFEDVGKQAGIVDNDGKGLGVAFADFDNDGWTDVFVANDSVRQQLYKNKGDGAFEDVALAAGAGFDENGKTFAGMGVDAADADNDGLPDLIITALSNETYPYFTNGGDWSFNYSTNTSNIGRITILNSGWGIKFADFDNDGLKDIFVAQSHVLDTIEKTTTFLKYKQPPLLMRNTGKGFFSVSATAGPAFNAPLAARGAATGDIDNDGDIDFVICQTDGSSVILRNNGTKNHWLGLSLVGAISNKNAFGAKVVVTDASNRKQYFEVQSGGSYISSNDTRLLVGLGNATSVKSVVITWPNGKTQMLENPAIDRYWTIKEK